MRKVVPVLLAGIVAAVAVLATSFITASTAHRRSIVLFVVAVALALPASWPLRRSHGAHAAASVWLGIAPLGFAIRGVMGRHVQQYRGMIASGTWTRPFARGALEWRVDTPILRGMWPFPVLVSIVWALVAIAMALLFARLARSRWSAKLPQALVATAWIVTLASLLVSGAANVREARRTDPVAWARALPELPRPAQLDNLRCDAPQLENEPVTFHGAEMDVEVRPLGCLVRLFTHHDTASTELSGHLVEKLTLHRDPVLGIDVAALPTEISIFRASDRAPPDPPISRIPLAHRVSGSLAAVFALALLSIGRRAGGTRIVEDGPYRGAMHDDALRDDGRLVRAASALAIATLGVAPLFTLLEAGLF